MKQNMASLEWEGTKDDLKWYPLKNRGEKIKQNDTFP